MIVSHVVATDEKGLIGKNNQLPWHMPADLKRFKEITTGHTIIMGRKTFESIGRVLPNRKHIVITRQDELTFPPEVTKASSVESALNESGNPAEVFIIGGSEIFRHSMPLTHRIYLTLIHHTFDGDTYYPLPSKDEWTWEKIASYEADQKNPYPFSYWVLTKK